MSPLEAGLAASRAASLAQRIHNVLADLYDLPEHGPGSKVEAAWDHMDVVVEALEEAAHRAFVRTGEWEILQAAAEVEA